MPACFPAHTPWTAIPLLRLLLKKVSRDLLAVCNNYIDIGCERGVWDDNEIMHGRKPKVWTLVSLGVLERSTQWTNSCRRIRSPRFTENVHRNLRLSHSRACLSNSVGAYSRDLTPWNLLGTQSTGPSRTVYSATVFQRPYEATIWFSPVSLDSTAAFANGRCHQVESEWGKLNCSLTQFQGWNDSFIADAGTLAVDKHCPSPK